MQARVEVTTVFPVDAPVHAVVANHGGRVLGVLSVLMGFAPISTDLYLPALPTMAAGLHADADVMNACKSRPAKIRSTQTFTKLSILRRTARRQNTA